MHNPVNAVMACYDPHRSFGELRMWFSPSKVQYVESPLLILTFSFQDEYGQAIPNTYDVCALTELDECHDIRDRITFRPCTLDDGTVVPPPSSELIRLHAACVKIAHMSGAAEVLDRYDNDIGPF